MSVFGCFGVINK